MPCQFEIDINEFLVIFLSGLPEFYQNRYLLKSNIFNQVGS